MNKIIDEFDMLRRDEEVALIPHVRFDVGIGKFMEKALGMPGEQLHDTLREIVFGIDFEKMGAVVAELNGVRIYIVRRGGKRVEIGMRQDLEQLGWNKMCDALDESAAEARK